MAQNGKNYLAFTDFTVLGKKNCKTQGTTIVLSPLSLLKCLSVTPSKWSILSHLRHPLFNKRVTKLRRDSFIHSQTIDSNGQQWQLLMKFQLSSPITIICNLVQEGRGIFAWCHIFLGNKNATCILCTDKFAISNIIYVNVNLLMF